MTRLGPARRAARAFAFARRMPLSKIARRVQLTVQRALHDRMPAQSASPPNPLPRSANPPLPIFPPRRSGLAHINGHRQFTFLNRTHSMPANAMDWHAPGPGCAHQLWRMNLHYMEYLEGAADDDFAALIPDWIANNPENRPGSWRDSWNSYALSLRTVVWMQQLALRSDRLPVDFRSRTETSLTSQLRFLSRNLETDLGGNHLIKNIKALLWGARYFCTPEAEQWKSSALALLQAELTRQILPDGMHDERSPSYHAQVFADLIECQHALGCDPFGSTLERMAQAVSDLAHPDGYVAQFNDAGLTMAYEPAVCLDAYGRLTGKRPTPRPIFSYRDAGYFGMRTRDTYLIIDCGRIGPDDLPAHGHGDVLSFELSIGGQRLIVDQGVFEYVTGERRQRSRSAGNHNTLCFDGADQADFFGAFRCGRRPNVTVRSYVPAATGLTLEGTHDGFSHLPGAPRHLRRFEAAMNSLTITDRIEGKPTQPAAVSFLLHPGASVSPTAKGAQITSGSAQLTLEASLPVTIDDTVWWPDMGHERPTRRLRIFLPPGIQCVTSVLHWTNNTPLA